MKRLIIDLDETITLSAHDGYAQRSYENALPNLALLNTSRSVRTFSGNIGKINAYTLPGIVAWPERHAAPFDEIHVGKPWCGLEGYYVDDKSIRPSEFLRYPLAAIYRLLAAEKAGA